MASATGYGKPLATMAKQLPEQTLTMFTLMRVSGCFQSAVGNSTFFATYFENRKSVRQGVLL